MRDPDSDGWVDEGTTKPRWVGTDGQPSRSGSRAFSSGSSDYRIQHTSPDRESGAPLHDLLQIYPEDVYSRSGMRVYGTGYDKLDREAHALAVSMKGKPDQEITVYRAVPKSTQGRIEQIKKEQKYIQETGKLPRGSNQTYTPAEYYDILSAELTRLEDEGLAQLPDINPGDWVTPFRQYATEHGESALNGEYEIVSKRVRAKDIFTDGNSWLEWGYDPSDDESIGTESLSSGMDQMSKLERYNYGPIESAKLVKSKKDGKKYWIVVTQGKNAFAYRNEDFEDIQKTLLGNFNKLGENPITGKKAPLSMSDIDARDVLRGLVDGIGNRGPRHSPVSAMTTITKMNNRTEVLEIQTAPFERRQGIGSELFYTFRETYPELDLQHSDALTDDGKAFSTATPTGGGEEIPDSSNKLSSGRKYQQIVDSQPELSEEKKQIVQDILRELRNPILHKADIFKEELYLGALPAVDNTPETLSVKKKLYNLIKSLFEGEIQTDDDIVVTDKDGNEVNIGNTVRIVAKEANEFNGYGIKIEETNGKLTLSAGITLTLRPSLGLSEKLKPGVNAPEDMLFFNISSDDDDERLYLGEATRTITLSLSDDEQAEVLHNSFHVSKSAQGYGIGSIFNARNEKIYEELGISTILAYGVSRGKTHTGATHWPKNGFTWLNEAEKVQFLRIINYALKSKYYNYITSEEKKRISSLIRDTGDENIEIDSDASPEELLDFDGAAQLFAEHEARIRYKRELTKSKTRQLTLSSGKAPSYPREPTLGAFIGSAEDVFDGVKSWEEFKERYNDKEVIFFDYETTGLVFDEFRKPSSRGAPVQFGAVKIKNGKEVGRINLFMNPAEPLGEWSRENLKDIDGNPLTDEWLSRQMSVEEAHRQLVEFAGPDALFGVQNAAFDKNVLDDVLAAMGEEWRPSGWIDTRELAALVLPKWNPETDDGPFVLDREGNKKPSSSLAAITEYLGVELGDGHHNADVDAFATSEVMRKMIDGAIENEWSTDALDKAKRDSILKQSQDKFTTDIEQFEKSKKEYLAGLSSGARIVDSFESTDSTDFAGRDRIIDSIEKSLGVNLDNEQRETLLSIIPRAIAKVDNKNLLDVEIHEAFKETGKRLLDSLEVRISSDGIPFISGDPIPQLAEQIPDKRDWRTVELPSADVIDEIMSSAQNDFVTFDDTNRVWLDVDGNIVARQEPNPNGGPGTLKYENQEAEKRFPLLAALAPRGRMTLSDSVSLSDISQDTLPGIYVGAWARHGAFLEELTQRAGETMGDKNLFDIRNSSSTGNFIDGYIGGITNPKLLNMGLTGKALQKYHDLFGHLGTGRGFDRHGEWANDLAMMSMVDHPESPLTDLQKLAVKHIILTIYSNRLIEKGRVGENISVEQSRRVRDATSVNPTQRVMSTYAGDIGKIIERLRDASTTQKLSSGAKKLQDANREDAITALTLDAFGLAERNADIPGDSSGLSSGARVADTFVNTPSSEWGTRDDVIESVGKALGVELTSEQYDIVSSIIPWAIATIDDKTLLDIEPSEPFRDTGRRLLESLEVRISSDGIPFISGDPIPQIAEQIPDKRDWRTIELPPANVITEILSTAREDHVLFREEEGVWVDLNNKIVARVVQGAAGEPDVLQFEDDNAASRFPLLKAIAPNGVIRAGQSVDLSNLVNDKLPGIYGEAWKKHGAFLEVLAQRAGELIGDKSIFDLSNANPTQSFINGYVGGIANPKLFNMSRGGSALQQYHDLFGHLGTGRGFDRHGEWANDLAMMSIVDHPDSPLSDIEKMAVKHTIFRIYASKKISRGRRDDFQDEISAVQSDFTAARNIEATSIGGFSVRDGSAYAGDFNKIIERLRDASTTQKLSSGAKKLQDANREDAITALTLDAFGLAERNADIPGDSSGLSSGVERPTIPMRPVNRPAFNAPASGYGKLNKSGKPIRRTTNTWLSGMTSQEMAEVLVPESVDQIFEMWADDMAPMWRDKPDWEQALRKYFDDFYLEDKTIGLDFSPEAMAEMRSVVSSLIDNNPAIKWIFEKHGAPIIGVFSREASIADAEQPRVKENYQRLMQERGWTEMPFTKGRSIGTFEIIGFHPRLVLDKKTQGTGGRPIPAMLQMDPNRKIEPFDAHVDTSIEAVLMHEFAHWLHRRALRNTETTEDARARSYYGSGKISDPAYAKALDVATEYSSNERSKKRIEIHSRLISGSQQSAEEAFRQYPDEPLVATSYGNVNLYEAIAEGLVALIHPNKEVRDKAISKKLRNDVLALLGIDPESKMPWIKDEQ